MVVLLVVLFISCKGETKQGSPALERDSNVVTKELEVYDFEGLEKFLTKEDHKTYVVNFWATWCAPCVKELPYFEKLHQAYGAKQVEVVLVSLDFPNQYEKRLKPFIVEHKLQSKVVVLNDVDSNAWIPKVSAEWSGAIPATLIYNKSKRQFYEQSFNYDELKNEVDKFLK
ncbi:TlpA family protein disulfide reductase [Lacinutrix neustonica]|nr:TlpA disulfide reductase family protein [Lacinutrix neustonica]